MLLLISDTYFPAQDGGGPVVSCFNLVNALQGEGVEIGVLTRASSRAGKHLEVARDQWVSREGQNIYFADQRWSLSGLWQVLQERKPDVVYVNGLFSMTGFVWPLLLSLLVGFKLVACPRGMLLPQALSQKSFKKYLFLLLIAPAIRLSRVRWHCTSPEEAAEMPVWFCGPAAEIVVLMNLPRQGIAPRCQWQKHPPLKLVSACLVSPMKNIDRVLEALGQAESDITYTLYGNIKDAAYWERCSQYVERLPANVEFVYAGPLMHEDVPAALAQHDVYIQPSRSENYGHSLIEAMMLGLPIITSHSTPWNDLSLLRAGENIDPDDVSAIAAAIDRFAGLSTEDYRVWAESAVDYARQRSPSETIAGYLELLAR